MTADGAGTSGGDALWTWVAFGVVVGVVALGIGGTRIEAGVAYGALGGLVVALAVGWRP